MVAITIFYSGELVWSEREKKVNSIYDSLPLPTWVTFSSKVVTLFGLQFFVLAVIMIIGMLIQTFQGYFNYEIGLYFKTLFLLRSFNYLLFCVLAITIQTIVNHKYLGFFVTILAYLLTSTFLPLVGLQHNLWAYSSDPGLPYSDMNGYGHFIWGFLTFKAYWVSLALLLLVVTNLFWVRGSETDLSVRFSLFKQRITTKTKYLMVVFIVAFAGLGGFIYYNTNILNQYITSDERRDQLAEFEKSYKKFDGIVQPKITSVALEIDLFPEDRNMDTRGIYILKNKSKQPIDSIHLNLNGTIDYHEISFSKPHKNVLFDSVGYYAIYEFQPPLQPGDSLELTFDLSYVTKGFTHGVGNTSIVENGTFFNSWMYPQIGYQPNVELSQQDLREEYDLPPKNRVPRIDDTVAVMNNFISNDADWIDFKATVSTSEDQIAIVPGYLNSEKLVDGRRYFEYAMDSKMLNFYSVLSAKYELIEDHWVSLEGDSVKLEIYYHKGHDYNLENMMNGMKKSLDYFTMNFGPYQHRQLRILEFPRYSAFAQSFANTVPFSEAIGFIADVEDEDVNYPFYVTSHEVAHQWWAHQVIGGNVQGSQFLSETMSQYGALMVMEKEFGNERMRDYLKQEMNTYLQSRSAESREEMPALLSEGQQYIHYNKGSIIMYALKDYIGEENLNSAIREYLNEVKFQEAPYTTTLEFYDHVKSHTPDSLQYVLTDLFETITLYENKIKDGHFEMIDSSNYEVTFTIDAAKFVADGYGNEDSVALNDYIDIGVFTRVKVEGDWQEKVLFLEKKKITSRNMTFAISVAEEPKNVGIDPYNKLIDRKPDDNILRISKKEDE